MPRVARNSASVFPLPVWCLERLDQRCHDTSQPLQRSCAPRGQRALPSLCCLYSGGAPVLECLGPASIPQRGDRPVGDVRRVNTVGKGSAHEQCDTASSHVLWLVYCGHDLLYGPGVDGGPQRLRGLCPPYECRIWLEPRYDLTRCLHWRARQWPESAVPGMAV